MMEAVKLAIEGNQLRGSALSVFMHLHSVVEGCIATISMRSMAKKQQTSFSTICRCINALEKTGQIQRLLKVKGTSTTQKYHLKTCCMFFDTGSDSGKSLCPKVAALSATSKPVAKMPSIKTPYLVPLLPEMRRKIEESKRLQHPLWISELTQDDLDFLSNDLRRKLGLPLLGKEGFKLA